MQTTSNMKITPNMKITSDLKTTSYMMTNSNMKMTLKKTTEPNIPHQTYKPNLKNQIY